MASRVFGWPRTTRLPSAIPSIVRSPPVASSITRRSGPPSSGSSSTASSSRMATAPGRSCRSWCERSTVGSRTRKPREPDEKTGLKQTGAIGIAELARGGLDLSRAVHAAEVGAVTPSRCSSA